MGPALGTRHSRGRQLAASIQYTPRLVKPKWIQAFTNWLRWWYPRKVSSSTSTNIPRPTVDYLDLGTVDSAHQTDTERPLHPRFPDGQVNAPSANPSQIPPDPSRESDIGAAPITAPVAVPVLAATTSSGKKQDVSTSLSDIPDAVDVERGLSETKERQNVPPRSRPKPPIDAPGRRGKKSTSGAKSTRSPRSPRPEVICRRNPASSTWQVVIVAENGLTSVSRQGQNLTIDRGECLLDSFDGVFAVTYGDTQTIDLEILAEPLITIFKFAANWSRDGRKVERVTSGHYIVIAPDRFTQIGHFPHESEPCDDIRYHAFFFHIEKRSETTDPIGFAEHLLPMGARNYRLEGKSLFDSSDMGPLFIEAVPALEAQTSIPWARIGEEREGGWRGKNFRPRKTAIEQVVSDRQGRFFLRVYDSTKLVDSGEFRYVRDLSVILVNNEAFCSSQVILPGPEGHETTTITLVGRGDVVLRPRLASTSAHATVRGNAVVVDPHADGDRVTCLLPLGEASVEVVVDLPRVWWRLDAQGEPSHDWQDSPLGVTRQRFRRLAMSDASVCLKLPRCVYSVEVGFDSETDRRYRRSGPDNLVRIPIMDFIDYEQIDGRPHDQLALTARISDAIVTFLEVNANPLPSIAGFESNQRELTRGEEATLSWTTRNAYRNGVVIEPGIGSVEPDGNVVVSPHRTTTYTLRLNVTGRDDATASTTVTVVSQPGEMQLGPCVRCLDGWRRGKGFSRGELELAGLRVGEVTMAHGFRVDKRRRTTHPDNAKTIKKLINA